MNSAETAYSEVLDIDQRAGRIHHYWFEGISVRLSHPPKGQPATYTPDFMILMPDGTTIIDDVKASYRDRAGDVRIKAAAELFPLWTWRIVEMKKRNKRDGGGYVIEKITEV